MICNNLTDIIKLIKLEFLGKLKNKSIHKLNFDVEVY